MLSLFFSPDGGQACMGIFRPVDEFIARFKGQMEGAACAEEKVIV
jgi:hypothetical protein